MSEITLFGFTLLRNGLKYDYCFKESLSSLCSLCEKTVIALGDSTDGTEQELQSYADLLIINTVWDETVRKSGNILSQQTNVALEQLRSLKSAAEPDAWAIYLQADEVIDQEDYLKIKKDILFASQNGYDAIQFRYLHFWLTHNQIAAGKKWYPAEVRAFRLNSEIKSTGDAQGFSGIKKIYSSEAIIYHYGHVRDEQRYKLKKEDFHKWYHADNELKKYQQKEERKYRKGTTLMYYGGHPAVMKERILRYGDIWQLPQSDQIWIDGKPSDYSAAFLNKINVKKIQWVNNLSEYPWRNLDKLIITKPLWWQKIFFPSMIGTRPKSGIGKDWSAEFILTLKLSEKKIGIKSA